MMCLPLRKRTSRVLRGIVECAAIVGASLLVISTAWADAECPPGTFPVDADDAEVTISDVSIDEGDSGTVNALFSVTLIDFYDDSNDLPLHVGFETEGGSATEGVDFTDVDDEVLLEPVLNSMASIEIPVIGDTEIELDEQFTVPITEIVRCFDNPGLQAAGTGGPAPLPVGTGTIVNDDVPALSIDDVQIEEGNSGTTNAVFTVRAEPTLPSSVLVAFETVDGTATVGDNDYQAQDGSVTIEPVAPFEATITVPVVGDTKVEENETFTVRLTGVEGAATIADGEGVGTILSDDVTSMVRIAAAEPVAESAGTARVVVERISPSGDPARVTVNAREGTATAGVDFQPVTAVVSWGADEGGPRTVQIPLLDDDLAEGDETIRVTLSAPENATLGSPSTADLRLLDDEQEGEIEIIGDGEPRGVVEREAELAVRVRSLRGAPIEGARIFWTADDETVEFTSGNPTLSGADGVSQQTVRLGEIPRIVIVRATLNPSTGTASGGAAAQQEEVSVEFRLRVRGDLDLASDADLDPENLSVGGVLDFACIEPQGEFADFCGYLFGLGDGQQRQVVQEATPREVAAQGNLMLDLPQWSFRHVGRRLAALRGGGSRRAEEELALVLGREEIKLAALVDTVRDAVARQARFDGAVTEALEAVSGWGQEGAGAGDGEEPQPRMDEELDALPRLGVFASGRVATAERDGTDREEGFEAGIEGLTLGADYRLSSDLILGGALGYLTTDLDLLNDGGGLDADGYSLTAYGAWMREALYVEGVVGYGSTSFDLRRHVDLPVPFQGATRFVALGETDGTQWMANLGTGWEIATGASSFELFGRASYVDAELDGYRERGGGPFDLEIRDQTLDSLLAEAGVSFGYAVSRDWGVLQPVVRAAALHEFGDDSRLVRGSFLGDVQQLEFVVPTEEPDRNFFNLGVGVTVTTYRGRSFYLFYDTDLARDDLEVGTFTLGARLEF